MKMISGTENFFTIDLLFFLTSLFLNVQQDLRQRLF